MDDQIEYANVKRLYDTVVAPPAGQSIATGARNAIALGLSDTRHLAILSRDLISQINSSPWWKRGELWNRYVFVRRLHKLAWDFKTGRFHSQAGEVTWL